jgi:hypothetical protein
LGSHKDPPGLNRARRLFEWLAEARVAALALLLIAVAQRLAWTMSGNLAFRDTELKKAAVNWATTGAIADAYEPGSGPTAHVGALPPVIAGMVFRLVGSGDAASILLTIVSASVVVATALVLNRLFARLGTPACARGAALAFVCVVPVFMELEARSLRVYENGYAALSLAALLLAAVRFDQGGPVRLRDMFGLSALAALLLGLSPIAGFAGVAVLGILALRRLDGRGRAVAFAVLVSVLVASALPWALRNQAVMGETVWTRGNFGLEFAVGTHDGAVSPDNAAAQYMERLAEVHPDNNPPALHAMRAAGGELPYARKLARQTWNWVVEQPGDALTIWARHAREFYFPPPWLWAHVGDIDSTMPWRMLIVDIVAFLALAGFVLALRSGRRCFVYLVPPVLLLPLPYLLTQPLVRYRYVIASLLVLLAADAIAQLVRRYASSRQQFRSHRGRRLRVVGDEHQRVILDAPRFQP